MTDTQDKPTTAERLRGLAEWLDAHPLAETSLSAIGPKWVIYHAVTVGDENTVARMTDVRRSIGGMWHKEDDAILGLVLRRTVLPGITYKLYAPHEAVCQRIVVATEDIEVEEPDPDAVAELPTVKRTVKRERVEWLCPETLLDAPATFPDGSRDGMTRSLDVLADTLAAPGGGS